MRSVLVILFLLTQCFSHAQLSNQARMLMICPEIKSAEEQMTFRGGVHPAQTIAILGDAADYLRDLKQFLKVKYGVETKKGSGYYFSDPAPIVGLCTDSLRLYLGSNPDGDGIKAFVLLEIRGEFLSSERDSSASKILTLLRTQAKEFYIKTYDEVIIEAQKNLDNQQKDYDKLVRKSEKLTRDKEKEEKVIQKTQEDISKNTNAILDAKNQLKDLESELDILNRELDQIEKEKDLNYSASSAKQKEYDQLNSKGELDSRKADKTLKALTNLRNEGEKIQVKLDKKKAEILKIENSILENTRSQNKLETKKRDLEAAIASSRQNIQNVEKQIEKNKADLKEEQLQIDNAKRDAELLASAKQALISRNQ